MAKQYEMKLNELQQKLAAKGLEIKQTLIKEGRFPADPPKQPKYKQLAALLNEYTPEELGVKKWFELYVRSAMDFYGGYDRHKNVYSTEIEVVYALFLSDIMNQRSICPNLNPNGISEFHKVCIKAKEDSIDFRVKATEDGYKKSTKETASKGTKCFKFMNQQITDQIAAIKSSEQYKVSMLISTLESEGFEVKVDGDLFHLFVNANDHSVDAGIIRHNSAEEMAEDLMALCDKCEALKNKRMDLSVIINKASKGGDVKEEETEQNNAPESVNENEEEVDMKENTEFAKAVALEYGFIINEKVAEIMAQNENWIPFGFMVPDNGKEPEKNNRHIVNHYINNAIKSAIAGEISKVNGLKFASVDAFEPTIEMLDDWFERVSNQKISTNYTASVMAKLCGTNPIQHGFNYKVVLTPGKLFLNIFSQGETDELDCIEIGFPSKNEVVNNVPKSTNKEETNMNKEVKAPLAENPFDVSKVTFLDLMAIASKKKQIDGTVIDLKDKAALMALLEDKPENEVYRKLVADHHAPKKKLVSASVEKQKGTKLMPVTSKPKKEYDKYSFEYNGAMGQLWIEQCKDIKGWVRLSYADQTKKDFLFIWGLDNRFVTEVLYDTPLVMSKTDKKWTQINDPMFVKFVMGLLKKYALKK